MQIQNQALGLLSLEGLSCVSSSILHIVDIPTLQRTNCFIAQARSAQKILST